MGSDSKCRISFGFDMLGCLACPVENQDSALKRTAGVLRCRAQVNHELDWNLDDHNDCEPMMICVLEYVLCIIGV